jgi:HD-like signal output (HDOD) protein
MIAPATGPGGAFTITVTTAILIVLLGAAAAVAVLVYRRQRRSSAVEDEPSVVSSTEETLVAAPGDIIVDAPYSTDEIQAAQDECYKLAFSVTHFDDEVFAGHAKVLERIRESAMESVHQREYFPRRPMLLPKLLQALNDEQSTRRSLVKLIVEDPALAGSVLQRANSAMYKTSREPIDSLDRAVQVLGVDGLRGLMAVAILQPVFKLPRGQFEHFADVTWDLAQRGSATAEKYAYFTRSADPFIAQLLGLLGPLARIVLFRLTFDVYREYPNMPPRAEVFIRSMQLHGPTVACHIAQSWELSELATSALQEQVDRVPPGQMRPLGRAAYFGDLCGTLALLAARNSYSQESASALLMGQGLRPQTVRALWNTAAELGRSDNR